MESISGFRVGDKRISGAANKRGSALKVTAVIHFSGIKNPAQGRRFVAYGNGGWQIADGRAVICGA